jgi:hypothetical protein
MSITQFTAWLRIFPVNREDRYFPRPQLEHPDFDSDARNERGRSLIATASAETGGLRERQTLVACGQRPMSAQAAAPPVADIGVASLIRYDAHGIPVIIDVCVREGEL